MNSKIDVRIEAARLAVNVEGVTVDNVIAMSERIANFILGDSELPEAYDTNAYLKELMAKMNPKPFNYENPVAQEAEEA